MTKSLLEAIQEVRPILEAMLAAEQVPPRRAEELLTEIVHQLCFKRPGVENPGSWLVHALHRAIERSKHLPSRNGHRTPSSPIS